MSVTERFSARGAMAVTVIAYAVASGLALASGPAVAADAGPVAPRASSPAQDQTSTPAPDQFVGDETCTTCHDAEGQSISTTMHGRAQNPRTPAASGMTCESCHGPGARHVENPEDPTTIRRLGEMPPRDVSAVCTTCHNRGEHALWVGGMHDRRGVTCTNCHSVHTPESVSGQLAKKTELEVCAACHRDKVAKLDRSGHMPVREGKIQCSTCHNMHGSQNVRLLRIGNSVNESCTSCHAEKRGPFLWEHAPVRENCSTCHDPHGSSNERMLVAKQPFLCQRCHVHSRHPATIYDDAVFKSSNRVYGRACVNCHSTIHGSVHPAGMTFQR